MVSSITVAEDRGLVCVADCMHGRVQCFHLDGRFSFIISSEEMGPYVLATEYCPLHGGNVYKLYLKQVLPKINMCHKMGFPKTIIAKVFIYRFKEKRLTAMNEYEMVLVGVVLLRI